MDTTQYIRLAMVDMVIFFPVFGIMLLIVANWWFRQHREEEKRKERAKYLDDYLMTEYRCWGDAADYRLKYLEAVSHMSQLLTDNKPDLIAEYYDSTVKPMAFESANEQAVYDGLLRIRDIRLKNIVWRKFLYAKDLGLNILTDIPQDVGEIPINVIDLAKIIGAFMDISILRAVDTDRKTFHTGIIQGYDKNGRWRTIIRISNLTRNGDQQEAGNEIIKLISKNRCTYSTWYDEKTKMFTQELIIEAPIKNRM